ncbi:MAG: SRPBCC family protein [Bauldia sp.]
MNTLKVETPAGEPIIVMSRTFDAPRALVWEAMTRAEHVARWWGPREMKTTVARLDVRPGGGWRFVHTAPDGRSIVFHGEYRDVQPPKCIVQTFGVEGMYDGRFIVETMTLEEVGDRTHYRVVSHFESLADRDGMIASGMERGANDSMERLETLLTELKPSNRRTA